MIAALLAFSLVIPPPLAPVVYHGRHQQLDVRVPRIEAGITVDGKLDEPEWARAALLTGFSQYAPTDGVAAEDSTEVLVWYSATAINFGVRAYSAPGQVHATLANRDRIGGDDNVQILIGTFNDGRQAMLFAVNPLGIQADGIITETGATRGGSGFSSAGSIREAPDLNPDFIFHSKGRVTDYGYEVEISIPFKTLRFQPKDVQSWGLQIIRKVQRNGHEEVWAPAKRAAASFLSQSGRLTGLSDMRRGLVLDVNPEIAESVDGAPNAAGKWEYGKANLNIGGNVRWGITDNLTLNSTVKPDFSQVEADVTRISDDPRRAIGYAEKRPFFLEGIEQFNVPGALIYTRDIVQPEGAAKLTGKISGTNIAYLGAVDGAAYSLTGNRPVFNIFRAQRDLSSASRIGVAYTDVSDGGGYNRVADIDTRVVWGGIYSFQGQYAQSFDRTAGVASSAPFWYARADRAGHNLNVRVSANAIADSFVTRAGFVSRSGIGHANITARYSWFGKKGALLESITPDAYIDYTWTYQDFIHGREVQDAKSRVGITGAFRGGWQVTPGLLVESFAYDSTLYRGYYVQRPRTSGVGFDTVKFTGTPRLPNVDAQLDASTPQFKYGAAGMSVIWGKDENFYEWSNANIVISNYRLDLRPTQKFRISANYQESRYNRRTDGSLVALIRIPRLKIEYQLTRTILFRYVGQYESDYRDALRDDSRTNTPLLKCVTVCSAIAGSDYASLRTDWLFAYQGIPGTVFFMGYGVTDGAAAPQRFNDLRAQNNGFFLKGSYLYRVK